MTAVELGSFNGRAESGQRPTPLSVMVEGGPFIGLVFSNPTKTCHGMWCLFCWKLL